MLLEIRLQSMAMTYTMREDNSSYLRMYLEARGHIRPDDVSEIPSLDILCMSCKRNDTSNKARYYCEECTMHICNGCILQHDWLFGRKHELIDFRDNSDKSIETLKNDKEGEGKIVRFKDQDEEIDGDYGDVEAAIDGYQLSLNNVNDSVIAQDNESSQKANDSYRQKRQYRSKSKGQKVEERREFVMTGSEFRKRREQGAIVQSGQAKSAKGAATKKGTETKVTTAQTPRSKGAQKAHKHPVSQNSSERYGRAQKKNGVKRADAKNKSLDTKMDTSKLGAQTNDGTTDNAGGKDIGIKGKEDISKIENDNKTNGPVSKESPTSRNGSGLNVANNEGKSQEKKDKNKRMTLNNNLSPVGEENSGLSLKKEMAKNEKESKDTATSGNKTGKSETKTEMSHSNLERSPTFEKARRSSIDQEDSFHDEDERELQFGKVSRSPYDLTERGDGTKRHLEKTNGTDGDTKERCDVHKEKTLLMYCKDHKQKGCMACVLLDHRFCERISYINDEKDDTEPEKTQQQLTSDKAQSEYIYTTANRTAFNVKDMHDTAKCDIFGCCLMPNGNIILVDRKNKKLKQLSRDFKLKAYLDIKEKPHDVCRTVGTELAISVNPTEYRHEILFANSINESLSFARKFQVDHPCYGLAFRDEELYVCSDNSVLAYKTSGQLIRKVYEDKGELRCWMGIALGYDCIYISKHTKDGILVLTDFQGNELSSISDQDMNWPFGICIASNGNVFVSGSSAIVQVNAKCTRKLATVAWSVHGVKCCQGLAFNKARSELIVGQYDDSILVLRQELTRV